MTVERITLGHIGANCYLIESERAAVVIDVGIKSGEAEDFLRKNSDKERMIILTHGHFDHICGAKSLRDSTNTSIAIGEKDAAALYDTALSMSDIFHAHQEPCEADVLLKDNQILNIGDLTLRVIETAGHTVGGVCLLLEDILFCGDMIFLESIGRTDFEGGSFKELELSIKNKIFTLPDETKLFSGHGEESTVGHEKRYNPFVRY